MRPTFVTLAALLLILSSPRPSLAQEEEEGTLLDIGGGVEVPVPRDTRPAVELISPPTGPEFPEEEQGLESTSGRESGYTVTGEGGQEVHVWQNSRVSGVTHSTVRDRFSWFYDAVEVYTGIIPRIRDSLPHIAPYQERGRSPTERNAVTWIGFQPLDSYTRVFVQLARRPVYDLEESEGGRVIAIVFENTRLSLSNFARFVDTSYFGRSVEMIDGENLPDQRARVIIWRSELAPYEVTVDNEYLYVDFQDIRWR